MIGMMLAVSVGLFASLVVLIGTGLLSDRHDCDCILLRAVCGDGCVA